MIYVDYSSWCVNEERSDEPYGEWSEEWEFSVNAVFAQGDHSCEMIDVPFNYNVGDTVHVLYMRHSSGDSFGHASGKGEVLWVFRERILAEKARQAILDNPDSFRIKCYDESLNEMYICNPASDYFSHIEDVYIESFIVGP